MLVRRLFQIACLALTPCLLHAAPAYDPSPFGINGIKYLWVCKSATGWVDAKQPARAMKQAGIYWDRDEMPWGLIQPAKDKWDFSCADATVEFNREQGINWIMLLSGCSAWSSNTPPRTDDERAAFAEYVYRMVDRYKGSVKVWEIWNEPNIGVFWPEPNAKDYTLLLKEAYKAAKRADPNCTILAGNTSGPDLTFIRGIYENGGWDYLDGICTHPYSMAGGPIAQKLDRILRMINEFSRGTAKFKPQWITEMGWTADNPRQERDQAIYVFQSNVIALANGVEKLCWFDLDDWQEKWGIIKTANPFQPKLAYGAYALMTEYLGSPGRPAEFKGWLKTPEGTACYVFEKPDRGCVLALWSSDDRTRTVDLKQRSGLVAIDILGKPVRVDGGCVRVGPVPIIVSGAELRQLGEVSRRFNPYLEKRGENLLVNGSLEIIHGSSPGWWNAGRFDGTAKDCTFETSSEGRGGSKCVSMSKSGERAAYDAVPTPVYPGRKYRLSAWVRTKDATGRSRIGLFWYTGNMWTYIGESRSEPVSGTTDWTKVTLTATAPKDATFVRANLMSENNSGTAWFDDVSLVEE